MNRAEMIGQSVVDARLPVLTDQEVRDNLRGKIEIVRKDVEKPFRVGPDIGRFLFSVTAEEQFRVEDVDWTKGTIGIVDSDRLQRLGLEVMANYGFNENNTKPFTGISKWRNDGIDDKDGLSREFKLYPSTTIDGLAFQRARRYVKVTGETLSVAWSVEDIAPFIKINLGSKKKAA